MSIESNKLMNLADGKLLYDDLRARIDESGGGGDPTEIIDDTAGAGDTDKVWSADKSASENSAVLSAIALKQDSPSQTGTAGQVLGLDSNLDPVWTDQTGGSSSDVEVKDSSKTGVDLDVSDSQGNVILRVADGHIKTKNFDSSNTGADLIRDSVSNIADLDISDIYGNVVGRFAYGGILVKEFDGRKYTTFSKSGNFTVGQQKTVVIDKAFKKDDRIVLHIETGADPWTSGGRVAYYAGNVEITDSSWRGAETYIEYKLTQNVSSISAVLPTNAFYENTEFSFEVSLLGDVPITPKIVTIKKDGSGDYTNLKACLAGIGKKANDVLNPYRIEIYPGTYDVLEDYTAEEKADIFYGETSINQYSQTSFVGPKLLNGMSLVGMGRPEDVILTAWLDPAPTDDLSKRQRGQISTLNLQGSGSIENLTIVAQNMRYCVHDDFSAPLGKKCHREVKNCVFRGYNIAYGEYYTCTTYGAGMPQGGMDFLFVGCDFGENAGVHTQPTLYQRPVIHLIDCKGHGFRIGDNETVSPITEYTVYRFDNCSINYIVQSMADSVPHVKVFGTGSFHPLYQFDPNLVYDTGEVVIVPNLNIAVGTPVEWYNDSSSHGFQFRTATSVDNIVGVVVYKDSNDTYVQIEGYIRTDRLGLSNISLNDYVGMSGSSCAVVVSSSDAFGRIVYVDNDSEGYLKLGGRF